MKNHKHAISKALKSKYFSSISWLFFEKVFLFIHGFFISIWVARYLGPKEFGTISYAIGIFAIINTFAALSLKKLIIKNISEKANAIEKLLGTALTLNLIAAAFGFLALSGWAVFTYEEENKEITICILLISISLFFSPIGLIEGYFLSKVNGKRIALARIISLFSISIFKVLLIISEMELRWFAFAFTIENLVYFSINYIFFYRDAKIKLTSFKFDKKILLKLFKDALPLVMASAVLSLYFKADQIIIKSILGVEAVGIYSAAVKISEMSFFIPAIIGSTFLSSLVIAKKESTKALLDKLHPLFEVVIWLSIILSFVLAAGSNIIIRFLFDESYYDASMVLQIHCWAILPTYFGTIWSNWIIIEGKQKIIFYNHLFSTLVNLGLNFLLIPYWGINGAAWATVIAAFAGQFIGILIFKPSLVFSIILSSLRLVQFRSIVLTNR